MDDNKLRALLTAVQCGSFGKAAAQLGYTQSAMTHLVNKLEAELGCTLLLRSSHGVRLSEEGEHLLPYINQVISACDALRGEAEVQGELYGRGLRIGCFASIARSRLPDLLQKFRKLHPEIKVDVLVQGNELADALEQDKIQLALVDEACAKGFHWTPLTDAPLVAAVKAVPVVSFIILALIFFSPLREKSLPTWNLITYYAAQILLALSIAVG